MASWLINHNQQIGLLLLGFAVGVVFAAYRQLRLERIEDDEWVGMMRRDQLERPR